MTRNEVTLKIVFKYSGDNNEVSLGRLTSTTVSFLDQMATSQLTSPTFFEIIGDGPGAEKFSRLLSASGYADDSENFFRDLLKQLGMADGTTKIAIGSVLMPHLFLVSVLEVVLPGNGFLSIKTVDALEKAANLKVPKEDRNDMQEVIDTYPVRLSMHTIRQMRVSRDVAYQYLPFTQELEKVGHTNTWIGQFHQGLLEQMYQNRVIFLLNMSCPVYCRFCFRKHKESRNEANPSSEDVQKAVEHVKNSPNIKEIVVTGGDPFMSRINMAATIDNLMAVEHVQTLRLATRSVAYYPDLFLADDGKLLTYLKRKHLELQEMGKRIELATHFIHPDEISPQCLMIITELVKSGIGVYIQTPFLNDCNDKGTELVRLFSLLRGAGAELHYIYIPCSPIHGNSVYWSPISKGHKVGNYLRAHLSDRMIPRICTATSIGKMDWHSSGWAVEPVADNKNFIWIRSPYTPEYFKKFAPLANELENIRVNEEGTLDIQYMAKIGDDSLFLGPRPPRSKKERPEPAGPETVAGIIFENEGISTSLVDTGNTQLSRVHETRVEVDGDISETGLDYIRNDERITDVVVFSNTDIVHNLSAVRSLAKKLDDIPHVNSLRLRSLAFNYEPHHYNPLVIDFLGGINKLTMVNPLRVEIETQFLAAQEITTEHGRLTQLLKNKGITVYNNTPLLGNINDSAEAIHQLAYNCREAGIEFHHLYVAGTGVQEQWNIKNPVELYDVVDIATKVRREGSGREIPRYIIKTELGEVDFGLTSVITGVESDLRVKMSPYDISYYRALSPSFEWPKNVVVEDSGHPVVPVRGILKTTNHPLS